MVEFSASNTDLLVVFNMGMPAPFNILNIRKNKTTNEMFKLKCLKLILSDI